MIRPPGMLLPLLHDGVEVIRMHPLMISPVERERPGHHRTPSHSLQFRLGPDGARTPFLTDLCPHLHRPARATVPVTDVDPGSPFAAGRATQTGKKELFQRLIAHFFGEPEILQRPVPVPDRLRLGGDPGLCGRVDKRQGKDRSSPAPIPPSTRGLSALADGRTTPKIRAVASALRCPCRGSAAYPIQPTSSPAATMKKRRTGTGIVANGTD